MTILGLPPNEDEPKYEVEVKPSSWEEVRRVQIFLNVAPWKCKCGLTMHGRVLKCVRESCRQSRPNDYKKHG